MIAVDGYLLGIYPPRLLICFNDPNRGLNDKTPVYLFSDTVVVMPLQYGYVTVSMPEAIWDNLPNLTAVRMREKARLDNLEKIIAREQRQAREKSHLARRRDDAKARLNGAPKKGKAPQ